MKTQVMCIAVHSDVCPGERMEAVNEKIISTDSLIRDLEMQRLETMWFAVKEEVIKLNAELTRAVDEHSQGKGRS